jgi:hypothetical protein
LKIGGGVERGANVGGNVVVGVVVGVERVVDGVAALLQAGLAGDLDGDPAQHHPRYCNHCARNRPHRSLFGALFNGFSFLLEEVISGMDGDGDCILLFPANLFLKKWRVSDEWNEVMGTDQTISII